MVQCMFAEIWGHLAKLLTVSLDKCGLMALSDAHHCLHTSLSTHIIAYTQNNNQSLLDIHYLIVTAIF